MSGTTLSSSAFTSSSPSSTSASSPGALSRFWRLSYSDISSRLVEYRHFLNVDRSRNWSIMLARAGGQALNFTAMFVLLPMLRSATHSIFYSSSGISKLTPYFTVFTFLTLMAGSQPGPSSKPHSTPFQAKCAGSVLPNWGRRASTISFLWTSEYPSHP